MTKSKGVVYALISSATFGLIPLFTLPVIETGTLSSLSILFYRLIFATIGIGVVALMRKADFRLTTKELPRILFLGIFYAATSLFLLLSYNYIPSGISTTIHFLYPVAVTLLMIIFFKERSSFATILSAIAAIVGVGLVSWTGDNAGQSTVLGIVYVLISVLTYGIYIVSVNKIGVERIDSFVLTFYVLLMGTLMIGGYAFATGDIQPIQSSDIAINLSLLAIISTVISNLTLVFAVKCIGSTVTAILGSMEPLVAVSIGVLLFDENIMAKGYVGVALIIASVMMIVLKGGNSQKNIH